MAFELGIVSRSLLLFRVDGIPGGGPIISEHPYINIDPFSERCSPQIDHS